ncbi:MAG: hypothetical protein D6739_07880 [Nitrospirae bacterium]|nr:MAG: hypothetical protein D6739_07880 [Nitrospirota bacterium]
MQGKRIPRWIWLALAAATAVVVACLTPLQMILVNTLETRNVIALHDERSPDYDPNCVSCHGTKTTELAPDGVTPMAHAVMMTALATTIPDLNQRCAYCHPHIRLQRRNPSGNTYTDTYANYLDPRPPLTPAVQHTTSREDINAQAEGTSIRKPYDAAACSVCHGPSPMFGAGQLYQE